MARSRKPPPSSLPDEIKNAANAERAAGRAAEEGRVRAYRGRIEKKDPCLEALQDLEDAVCSFKRTPTSLYRARRTSPDQGRSLLPKVLAALRKACTALKKAGRLKAWKKVRHDETYRCFTQGSPAPSKTTYDWARRLLDQAIAGQLSRASLAETWETEELQESIYFVLNFIRGLCGDGFVLPGTDRPGNQFSANHKWVLLRLLEMHPCLCFQAEFGSVPGTVGLSRGTAGKVLKDLRALGLTHRPNGERGGEGLTETGLELARTLPDDPLPGKR
jgi:hypothetical protein